MIRAVPYWHWPHVATIPHAMVSGRGEDLVPVEVPRPESVGAWWDDDDMTTMLLDDYVPAGRVISTAEPETEPWYATRRKGITATDLPKILGLSVYGNARSVWHDKRGELPDEAAGEAARWGQLLEDVVAQEWSARQPFRPLLVPVGTIANDEVPWALASLDRVLDSCPDEPDMQWHCAAEVKTRSSWVASSWRDDMPDTVLAQVAWQRFVTGFDHVHVVCLLGGQELVAHRYNRDTELESYLLRHASDVWQHVLSGDPPPVDMDGMLALLLERMFPDRSGQQLVEPELGSRLAGLYAESRAAQRAADRAKDTMRAEVLSALGDRETLVAGGEPLFTYRSQARTGVRVGELMKGDPDLYARLEAGGWITSSTNRVLRFAGKGDEDAE